MMTDEHRGDVDDGDAAYDKLVDGAKIEGEEDDVDVDDEKHLALGNKSGFKANTSRGRGAGVELRVFDYHGWTV